MDAHSEARRDDVPLSPARSRPILGSPRRRHPLERWAGPDWNDRRDRRNLRDRVTAIRAGGERIPSDRVVWTAPLTTLNGLLDIQGVDLEYLSTIFYNLEIAAPPKLDYQWTYFGGSEVFSRVTSPEAFLDSTTPAGKSGLCVELTCRQGDERWHDPERYVRPIIADLLKSGAIDRESDVDRVHIERVPFTYPIYKLNYKGELTRNFRMLGRYSNLLLAGRCGRFWYNNMDHSIGQALTMADKIGHGTALNAIGDEDREFWSSDRERSSTPVTAIQAG